MASDSRRPTDPIPPGRSWSARRDEGVFHRSVGRVYEEVEHVSLQIVAWEPR